MVQIFRDGSGVRWLGWLALVSVIACAAEQKAPPPVFERPDGSGGGAGAPSEGGSAGESSGGTSGRCSKEEEGCTCDEIGKTVDCKVYEQFDDYVTCTIGVYTCGDDLIWGPCIGERTTQTASSQVPEDGARGN
jgi:hypothetical protein